MNAIAQENEIGERLLVGSDTMMLVPLHQSIEKQGQHKAGKRVEPHRGWVEPDMSASGWR